MAILGLGHRCDWKDSSQGFKWAWIHFSGNWLLHQVGGSSLLLRVEGWTCGSVLRKQRHMLVWGTQEIISNNGSHFKGEVRRFMEEYGIEHHKSSPYRPQANGTVKAANKNVKNILAKMLVTYKDWAEKLTFVLWGYRTSIRASTRATPTLWSMVVRRCFLLRWRYNFWGYW